MRFSGVILLFLMFLLNGCFSGNGYSSGVMDNSELRKMKDERRMSELKHTRLLRLGVQNTQADDVAALRKNLEAKGWKIQEIPCPEKRLTGLLRSGTFDLIYYPGASGAEAERLGFYFAAPSFFIDNSLILQEIR